MIRSINKWFATAKPSVTPKDVTTQIGCHFEEVSEMLVALKLESSAKMTTAIADVMKELDPESSEDFLTTVDHVELLDALCDQIVTAVGVANMLGYRIENALAEVDKSNWSKFENGRVLKDKNGKIQKGKDYFAPYLVPYINKY